MNSQATSETVWVAPGPGMWERDAAHQDRPFSRLWLECSPQSFQAGAGEAFARFGVPLAGFEIVDVGGWFFGTLKPVDEEVFPIRIEAAERALAERPWRAIADEWFDRDRAVFVRRNRELQAIAPARLDDEALAAHIADALNLLADASTRHFLDAVAHWVGVGLLINEAEQLAGWTPDRTILALAGASPASTAPVAALRRIASAIEADPRASALLANGGDPETTIGALRASSAAVDEGFGAYLEAHGWQVFTGFDFTHQAMAELPALLLETIRKVAPEVRTPVNTLARLLEFVPAADRDRVAVLIEDATVVYGLRDDDSGPTIQQPVGLVRRALLEAGARLAARGALLDADDIFDAARAELTPLLTGRGSVPSSAELSERASRRRHSQGVPPRRLGQDEPPPDEPLPPAMATIVGALFAAMSLEDTADEEVAVGCELRGAGASAGVYEGRACVVRDDGDFESLRQGDVLVAPITTPAYNVILPLVGAVVTDRGGILSHPAIVAREYGIPAVVGTNHATSMIRTGDRVRVDGLAGTVTILS